MCYPSYLRSLSAIDFTIKRFFRVIPLFWFSSVAFVFFCFLCGHIDILDCKDVAIRTVKSFVSLDAGWTPQGALNNGSLWTIPLQIEFYLLTPFIANILNKSKLTYDCILFGGAFVIGILYESLTQYMQNVYLTKICLQHLYIYLGGMISYKYRLKIIPFLVKYVFFIFFLYLFYVVSSFEMSQFSNILLILFVLGIAYRFGKKRTKIDCSYGIYIWHMPIFSVISYTFCQYSLLFIWIITIVLSIVTFF